MKKGNTESHAETRSPRRTADASAFSAPPREKKSGWVTKKLGDFAAAVSTGPFGSILHKSDYVDDGVPLVTGTAQKTVSLKLLRSFVVPKVLPKQQKQAVETLDTLSAETQRLAGIYERKLAALEALKRSLLHQAFNGEL